MNDEDLGLVITYRAGSAPESSGNTGPGSRYLCSAETGHHPQPEHLQDIRCYQYNTPINMDTV